MDLLFRDLQPDGSASVDVHRRADDFRVISSITLCELIDVDLESGRIFLP